MSRDDGDIVSRLVFELNIVASVSEGQRISTTDNECLNISDESIGTSLSRWRYGDSRERLIVAIEYRISLAYRLCCDLIESRYMAIYADSSSRPTPDVVSKYTDRKTQLHRLINVLTKLPRGLETLSKTYRDNSFIVFRLKKMAEMTTNRIVNHVNDEFKKIKETEFAWHVHNAHSSADTTVHYATSLADPALSQYVVRLPADKPPPSQDDLPPIDDM